MFDNDLSGLRSMIDRSGIRPEPRKAGCFVKFDINRSWSAPAFFKKVRARSTAPFRNRNAGC